MPITAQPALSCTVDSAALSDLVGRLKEALSIDFPDVDTRLQTCIASAKAKIERYTGCLLSPGTVSVSWGCLYDYENLPSGPVRGPVAVSCLSGTALVLTAAQLPTGPFARLTGDFPAGIALSYPAGYDAPDAELGPLNLPDDLIEAVVQLAANLYDGGGREWMKLARPYCRWGWGS